MVYCYDGKEKHEKVLPIPPTCFFLTITDSKCWCAIMRSEKTHTLACNEFFGMQWITNAAARSDAMSDACNEFFGMQWITDAAARSDAMNDGCWCAIVRSEKTHTLACNEFFGVQWITDAAAYRVQWITAADTPSRGHTRWPATNSKCWLAIVRSEKTHTLTCNEFRLVMWLRTVRDVPTDVRVEGF